MHMQYLIADKVSSVICATGFIIICVETKGDALNENRQMRVI